MGKFSDAFCALALQQFLIQYEILLTYYKGVRGGGGEGNLTCPTLISLGLILRAEGSLYVSGKLPNYP